MTPPTIGVLALQGDFREHESALAACGLDTARVRNVADLDKVTALVVPGGESTTMSKLAITNGLVEPIRERIAAGMPVFGTCAGMIMVAREVLDGRPDQVTFGGLDIVVRRNAFGRQVDSFEATLPAGAFGGSPLPAVFIRAPWVEAAGPEVEILARVEDDSGAGRIVAVRQGSVLATSFHPELTGDLRVHEYFKRMLQEA